MLVLTVLNLMYLGESNLRTRGGIVARRHASIHNSRAGFAFPGMSFDCLERFPSAVMPGDFFRPYAVA